MLAKPRPRADEKAEKKKQADTNRREVYRLVELRDSYCCRSCRRRLKKTMEMNYNQLHHHHIVFRSRGGKDETSGVCLICRECHDKIHVHRSLTITGNADSTLEISDGAKTWHG